MTRSNRKQGLNCEDQQHPRVGEAVDQLPVQSERKQFRLSSSGPVTRVSWDKADGEQPATSTVHRRQQRSFSLRQSACSRIV